jgi:hypothetical protein
VEQGAELDLTEDQLRDPEGDAHLAGDDDHAPAVAARVLVGRREDLAQKVSRAAVRVSQREHRLDPRLALAGEDRDQAEKGEHEQRRPWLGRCGEGREEPDRRQEGVDAVDRDQLVRNRANPQPQSHSEVGDGRDEIERELGAPSAPRWLVQSPQSGEVAPARHRTSAGPTVYQRSATRRTARLGWTPPAR